MEETPVKFNHAAKKTRMTGRRLHRGGTVYGLKWLPLKFNDPVKDFIMKKYLLAPSILSADFARLGEEVDAVIQAGADWIHVDVMDNHYVPNLTIGPLICKALRHYGIKAPLDVHLMITPVDDIIPAFAQAGATFITFHPEATFHVNRTINLIKKVGCQAGLAFNPATPLTHLHYTLPCLDLVLLMTVNPGFGGQAFIPESLNKIQEARTMMDAINPDLYLAVDGGIHAQNIQSVAQAGANVFIAGSAIFNHPPYSEAMQVLRQEIMQNK